MTATKDIPIIRMPALYPKQHAVFFDPARVVVCEATTKAGKSVGAATWLIERSFTNAPGSSKLYVSMTYPQAEIQWERMRRLWMRADPNNTLGWDSHGTKLWFRLPNGTTIWYKGGDRPDTIYGTDYSDAVVDEGSRCKEEVWAAVLSTTTATDGQIRIIGNVKGRKNWAYSLGQKARNGAPGMAYHRLTCEDAVSAGVLKQQTIDDAKGLLPEAVFRELFYAEASDDGGNPFGLAAIAQCVGFTGAGPIVAFGVDLAKSVDWSVIVGLNMAGQVVWWDRWQGPWETTERRLVDVIGQLPALIDSTGVGDPVVEGLQRKLPAVEGFKFSSQSKQQIMEGLAVAIQSKAVVFPEGPIRNELEAFEYEYTRTGVRYSAPEGMHDDCVCALALAVHKLNAIRHAAPVCVEMVSAPRDVADFSWHDVEEGGNGWN